MNEIYKFSKNGQKNKDFEISKSENEEESVLLNPELDGGSFFWKAGETWNPIATRLDSYYSRSQAIGKTFV